MQAVMQLRKFTGARQSVIEGLDHRVMPIAERVAI